MKRLLETNINNPDYWDSHQTATDFGLRQEKYAELAGKGERVIELGCGLSPFLSRVDFKERWGVDYSPKTIEEAKKLYSGVNFAVGSATETPFRDNYFDVAVAGEIIEHLEKPWELVREMERIARKIIISTPILEFLDPEHLWQFYVDDFKQLGFNVEVINSDRFKGRSYIFASKIKEYPWTDLIQA